MKGTVIVHQNLNNSQTYCYCNACLYTNIHNVMYSESHNHTIIKMATYCVKISSIFIIIPKKLFSVFIALSNTCYLLLDLIYRQLYMFGSEDHLLYHESIVIQ